METMQDVFGPVISSYSRSQAIEDGVLVDVSETAREAGITYPVALTRTVWSKYVDLPKHYKGCQDVNGRLWDVISMFRFGMSSASAKSSDTVYYRLKVSGRLVTLKAVCGAGDTAEPVITIMEPNED